MTLIQPRVGFNIRVGIVPLEETLKKFTLPPEIERITSAPFRGMNALNNKLFKCLSIT